jgi:ACS family hexuronate transporter-like MFS transporter
MFLATVLAYMDRQTLASTADYIVKEFGLSEEDYGTVESAFGLTFALFQVPAGIIADRWNIRWLYALALLLWSAAGFAVGVVPATFGALLACRLVLGIGEAFNWPCAVGIVRRVIPLESRALANGIFHSGASVGAALTPLVAIALISQGGGNWRLLFLLVGGVGLVWTVLWLVYVHGARAAEMSAPVESDSPSLRRDEVHVPFLRMFLLQTFWITLAVGIAVNICWHFYRIWLTRFLRKDLSFTQEDIQWVLVGFFIAADLGSLLSGWVTRRLTYAGYSVERSRKLVLLGASLLCLLSTPAALVGNPWLTLPLVFVVAAGSMAGFPIFFALSQAISPRHTSLCLGIFGCLAWLCITAMNRPVGRLADQMGTFAPSLIAVGFVPLVGAMILLLWPEPPPIKPPTEIDEPKLDPVPEEGIQTPANRIKV